VEPLPWNSALVRPYAHTGGRTRSSQELAVEALVSASSSAFVGQETVQRQRIVDLCAQPKSVAEVAALLAVPLGVARVLVGDLASDGAVVVHATVGAPDLEFMRRVLVGLRRL
jgi:hypothetical protein